MKVKAVTTITSATTGTGAAGSLITPDRRPGVITPPQRALTIRNLLLPGRTSSSTVEFELPKLTPPPLSGPTTPITVIGSDLIPHL